MSQEERTEATSRPEQPATYRPRLKWTIMIYLAGDNNLSANSLSVLQQLEAANIPRRGDVRVLACFDANTPRPKGARYLEIRHRRFNSTAHLDWGLHNDLVPAEALGTNPVIAPDFCNPAANTSSAPLPVVREGLSRFLNFALKNHPAERYMLILYGHGTAVAGNTFLTDNNPPSFLRLGDFAEVLKRHFDVSDDAGPHAGGGMADAAEVSAEQARSGAKRKPALDILACDNCIMNGIEAAYEVKDQVRYILGSQGLALAVGWPFRKIINAVVRHRHDQTVHVAKHLLRVCARSLIDFTLMDRSSEQSLCDLTTLHYRPNLVSAIKQLSEAMRDGLAVYRPGEVPEGKDPGEVIYPAVRDAIRLARLETQSYWSERFVDLYDFCALLLQKCNENLEQAYQYLDLLKKSRRPAGGAESYELAYVNPRDLDVIKKFGLIARRCRAVLREIKTKRFVLSSYYIGPALQYSNGVSIYFPWTLPDEPVIFEPVGGPPTGVSAGRYGISWTDLDKLQKLPEDYTFKTAFDEYKTYKFAKESGGDWARFLESFFRATLRDVRRFDFRYVKPQAKDVPYFFDKVQRPEPLIVPPQDVNLQKSSSDNDSEEDCTCPEIKNYPRRFYLSPADCHRRDPETAQPPVSYLGWNIRGLAARVIGLGDGRPSNDGDETGFDEVAEPDADESEVDELDADELEADEQEE